MNILFYWKRSVVICCLLAGIPRLCNGQAQDTLWGMTQYGGTNGSGILFKLSADSANLQVAYSFGTVPNDGYNPNTSLTQAGGLLYGFTTNGGANYGGEIFSYDPVTGLYTKLYDFDGTHGSQPIGRLTLHPNGLLYGVAQNGGANYQGVIFSFNPVTNVYTDVYDMVNNGTINNGSQPSCPLTLYNNVLYGLNTYGGANYGGVVYSFDPVANVYTDLNDLTINPNSSSPMVGYQNTLYGILSQGGAYYKGLLFSVDLTTHAFAPVFNFNDTLGVSPVGVILYNNLIYGVTSGGGQVDSNGSVFSFNPATKRMSRLDELISATGYSPSGNITAYHGKLFGMTSYGGANAQGVIYQYDLLRKTYRDLLDLGPASGYNASGTQLLLVTQPIGNTAQTVTFADLTKTYGDTAFDGGATASSGLSLAYVSDNPGVATTVDNNIYIVGAGTAHITAIQAGNSVYDSASATAILTVAPANLLITADDTLRHQGKPNPVFRASYNGFVNGDSSGSLTVLPTLSTPADSLSVQGTYPITASGAIDPNYTITYQAGILTVAGLVQTISFTDTIVTYGAPDTLLATASSGLPVTYSSSDPAVALITPAGMIHFASVGTTQLIASQAGDATYSSTASTNTSDTVTLRVTPAALTILANNATKVYLQPDPVFTLTYIGFTNGDDSNALTTKPVVTTTAAVNSYPGGYFINVGGAADSNYTISYVSGAFVITPVGGKQQNSLNAWFSSGGSLTIDVYALAAQQGFIQVFDLTGHQLVRMPVTINQGFNPCSIYVPDIAAGVYIIRVGGDNLNLSKIIRKIN